MLRASDVRRNRGRGGSDRGKHSETQEQHAEEFTLGEHQESDAHDNEEQSESRLRPEFECRLERCAIDHLSSNWESGGGTVLDHYGEAGGKHHRPPAAV